MNIKVLGGACLNCKRLEDNTIKALEDLGIEAEIEKIEDYAEIVKYGVMKTPALVVDEKVVIMGKVAKPAEIKKHLK